MRRAEFEVNDPEAVAAVLDACEYGVLSLISRGEPYGVAVNFAYHEGHLYFHGAAEGRKVEAVGEKAQASFLAVKPYAFIPSYFSDTRFACPATQYFASVHLSGEVIRLEAPEQKAFGLGLLMKKMQPEGGYEPIAADSPVYTKMLEKTAVFMLVAEVATLKVKVGQNLGDEQRAALVEKLKNRDHAHDTETADAILSHARRP